MNPLVHLPVVLIALVVAGCPSRSERPAATGTGSVGEACERVGQQCRLGDGLLGVCQRPAGRPDAMECMPQH